MPHLAHVHEVSCIFPAYNEAECLGETITEWARALASCTRSFELVVVDDGSRDGTAAVLLELATRVPQLRVLTHERNLGYGAAIAHGFAQASFPLACFVDADGQYDPTDLPILLDRLAGADVVVGYRVRRADSAWRRLMSTVYNTLVRVVLGIPLRDLNCAFKLMPSDTFRRIGVTATDFSVNADLALRARAAGLAVAEVPVRHRPRYAGRSTVRPAHVVRGLLGITKLLLDPRLSRSTPGR